MQRLPPITASPLQVSTFDRPGKYRSEPSLATSRKLWRIYNNSNARLYATLGAPVAEWEAYYERRDLRQGQTHIDVSGGAQPRGGKWHSVRAPRREHPGVDGRASGRPEGRIGSAASRTTGRVARSADAAPRCLVMMTDNRPPFFELAASGRQVGFWSANFVANWRAARQLGCAFRLFLCTSTTFGRRWKNLYCKAPLRITLPPPRSRLRLTAMRHHRHRPRFRRS